jgi:hypothetical protein
VQCVLTGSPLIFRENFVMGSKDDHAKTADPHTELAGTLSVVHGLPSFGVLKPNSQKCGYRVERFHDLFATIFRLLVAKRTAAPLAQ